MTHSFFEALERALSSVVFLQDMAKADTSHQAREIAKELEAAHAALRRAETLSRKRSWRKTATRPPHGSLDQIGLHGPRATR